MTQLAKIMSVDILFSVASNIKAAVLAAASTSEWIAKRPTRFRTGSRRGFHAAWYRRRL